MSLSDNTTFHACDDDLNNLIKRLEHNAFLATEWFENIWVKMGNEKIWENAKPKLLGMEIGRYLNFDDHVISLCKKAGKKLAVLARLFKFMSFQQK